MVGVQDFENNSPEVSPSWFPSPPWLLTLSSTAADSRSIHFSPSLLWTSFTLFPEALEAVDALLFFHLLPQSEMFPVFRVILVLAPWK